MGTWLKSPSGWPINVADGGLTEQRLLASGWQPIPEADVAAAVTAYNLANGVSQPPAAVGYLTDYGLVLSATPPPSPAPGTVWINTAV